MVWGRAIDKRIAIGAAIVTVVLVLAGASLVMQGSQGKGGPPGWNGKAVVIDHIVSNETVVDRNGSVVHTADDFTAALQWAVSQPGTGVRIPAGVYEVEDTVRPLSDVALVGDGDGEGGTVLDFVANDPSHARISLESGVNNVTLADLRVTGNANIAMTALGASCGGHVLQNVTAYRTSAKQLAAFSMHVVSKGELRDIQFIGCKAVETDHIGFFVEGDGYYAPGGVVNTPTYSGWVRDLYFEECVADHCGYYDRYNSWVVGFDLAESANVENVKCVRCVATYCWESGFHFEPSPSVRNALLIDCVASNNGQKPDDHENDDGSQGLWFGMGYYWNPYKTKVYLINCSGTENALGLSPLSL